MIYDSRTNSGRRQRAGAEGAIATRLRAGLLDFRTAAELAHVQVVVEAALCQQFLVAAAFHDLALIQHQHLIGVADGAEPVGDDEAGAVLEQVVQRRLDESFGARIDAGSCLVQDQDARVAQRSTCDGDQLALAREGTRAEELAEARALLSQREADLQRMEAGYRVEEIAATRAQASAAEAEVASIERQLRELAVASPCDCLVEAVDLEPGDLVAANAPVLTLIDPHDLWIRAYIPENRLDISVGQKVSIRVDAFPERRFAGHVSFVSRKAEFTPANVQTPDERVKQMFRVKVELDEGQDTLRAGMAADVFLEAPAK